MQDVWEVDFISINTIDKNQNLCYNRDKLENKINILANKTKIKKEQKVKFALYENEQNYDSELSANKAVIKKLGHTATIFTEKDKF